MINKVQAFNSRNNYNQNFGMVRFEDGGAEILLNSIIERSGLLTGRLNTELAGIKTCRALDRLVDVVFSNGKPATVNMALVDKSTGAQIPESLDSFSYDTQDILGKLLSINKRAQKIESDYTSRQVH